MWESTLPPDLHNSFTALPHPPKELGPAGRVVLPEDITAEASSSTAATTSSRRGSSGSSFTTVDPAGRGGSSAGGPETWTYAEVEAWLVRIKCGQHAATFREKYVDGMALSGMLRYGSGRGDSGDSRGGGGMLRYGGQGEEGGVQGEGGHGYSLQYPAPWKPAYLP